MDQEFNKKYFELSEKLQNTLFGTFPVFYIPYSENHYQKKAVVLPEGNGLE